MIIYRQAREAKITDKGRKRMKYFGNLFRIFVLVSLVAGSLSVYAQEAQATSLEITKPRLSPIVREASLDGKSLAEVKGDRFKIRVKGIGGLDSSYRLEVYVIGLGLGGGMQRSAWDFKSDGLEKEDKPWGEISLKKYKIKSDGRFRFDIYSEGWPAGKELLVLTVLHDETLIADGSSCSRGKPPCSYMESGRAQTR